VMMKEMENLTTFIKRWVWFDKVKSFS
jgi:hypothetical protein